jgi:Fic family protein
MLRSGRYISFPNYKAFSPSPLPPAPALKLDGPLYQSVTLANAALHKLASAAQLLPHIDLLQGIHIRKEAIANAHMEGIKVSWEDLFEHEEGSTPKNVEGIQTVVNYMCALEEGMKQVENGPLDISLVQRTHETLCINALEGNEVGGEFRKVQNWVGPSGSPLQHALFIPPPPSEIAENFHALERFWQMEEGLPPLVICALNHYQMETVAPFMHKNGSIARLLTLFYCAWKKIIPHTLLYPSHYFYVHRHEYHDRLNLVREQGAYEQWIGFFLRAVIWTAQSAFELMHRVLKCGWEHRKILLKKKISSPLAIGLLDYLAGRPYLSVQEVADHLQTSYQTGQTLVAQFVELDILREVTGKRRGRRFIYWEYFEELQ